LHSVQSLYFHEIEIAGKEDSNWLQVCPQKLQVIGGMQTFQEDVNDKGYKITLKFNVIKKSSKSADKATIQVIFIPN
jgi:ABC-type phosphate/phosphonate transport system substrate-binding protein